MAYELPINITTISGLIDWAERISNHTLTSTFIVTMSLVVFVATLNSLGEQRALLLAAFMGFIASLIFNIVGLINGYVVIVYGLIIAIGILWIRFS